MLNYIKTVILTLLLGAFFSNNIFAESYIRDYTYTASEADSKLTSRVIALDQIKVLLLQEIGTHIRHELNIKRNGNGEELANEDIKAITAGFTKIDILEDRWDGKIYYLKAKLEASTQDVLNALETFKKNKSEDDKKNLEALKANQLELENARQRIKNLQTQLVNKQNITDIRSAAETYRNSINDISKQLINIRVPSYIENGRVTPYFVNFTPSVTSKDKIYVLVGDEKLAYIFSPSGDTTLSHVSGRIKNRFGKLTVVVKHADGTSSLNTASLPGHIFSQNTDGPHKSAECKKRAEGNHLKMLCENNMGTSGYIDKVDITLPNGSILVEMTPNASMNPFLWVTGNFDATNNQTHSTINSNQYIDSNRVF
ncbi:MAG: hypothetical protein B7Y56_12170 [Gallionellales bacterium 35-53-114]|jgi:hypothetical protein|nr:MAG: hypothetical protein B7Y56_12170 [Gallionellales bacterium 35-53-114]OYZ64649.1 MAG: hypothetical protein B7Y04_02430 [Gallionellales bacterium 24-53-125]OZB07812.1 MAG: hypothetical protein B7X61_14585 [Gallionellales bacterium 39-52-133]HQS58473.1 hypothetical protein [Gallionellaceae bacterium]HQS74814.1 hypothetical protein [Gallionellaceae bacterium]